MSGLRRCGHQERKVSLRGEKYTAVFILTRKRLLKQNKKLHYYFFQFSFNCVQRLMSWMPLKSNFGYVLFQFRAPGQLQCCFIYIRNAQIIIIRLHYLFFY